VRMASYSTGPILLREEPVNKKLLAKEANFNNPATRSRLPQYSSLHDANLRAFWSSPATRNHLTQLGFLDDKGNIIDLDQYRRKLHVIHKELQHAEKMARDSNKSKELDKRDHAIVSRRKDVENARGRDIANLKDERKQLREHRSNLTFNASRSLLSSAGSQAVHSAKSF